MDPRNLDIQQLLPHRPPMVMVDRLVSVKEDEATSVFLVKPENIFVEKGLFREEGVLENMAQTAAALNGFRELEGGGSVLNGYIGGVKDLEILSLPSVGQELVTVVKELHRVMGAVVLSARCTVGNRSVARCGLKVFMELK